MEENIIRTKIDEKSLFRRHGHPPACLCVKMRGRKKPAVSSLFMQHGRLPNAQNTADSNIGWATSGNLWQISAKKNDSSELHDANIFKKTADL